MKIIGKEVSVSKRLKFEADHYEDGYIYMEYRDPEGNEEKKGLIEDLINRVLDEAKIIIDA